MSKRNSGRRVTGKSTLTSVYQDQSSGSREAAAASWQRRATRGVIEQLEGRVLFAAVRWLGGSGDFATAAKWSTGVVPNYQDAVTIPAGSSVTLSAADGTESMDTLTTAAGSTLTVAATAILSARSGSTINGTLNLNGDFEGFNGSIETLTGSTTFSGTGTVDSATFINTGTAAFHGGGVSSGTFINQATATVTGGMFLGGGGIFKNAAGGTVTITDDGGFNPSTYNVISVGTFINSGTLIKSGGTGTSSYPTTPVISTSEYDGGLFQNIGGTIDVKSGTFVVRGSADLQNTTFNVAAGATFSFTNSRTDNFYSINISGTIIGTGGGKVLFDKGTVTDRLPGNGDTNTTASLNFPSGMLSFGQAEIDNYSYQTSSTTNLGFIDVNGSHNLSIINQGTIRNIGTGPIPFTSSVNDTTGVIDLTTDGGISDGGINNTSLTNKGTIAKSGTSGTSIFTAAFLNSGGTLDIESGTISFQEGRIGYIAGPLHIATGSVLNFATSYDVLLQGTLSSTGGGIVTVTSAGIDGPSSLITGLDPTGTGTLNFAPNTLYFKGGYIDEGRGTIVNAGTAYFQGGGSLSTMDNTGTIYFDASQYAPFKGTAITNETAGTIVLTGATSIVTGVNCHIVNAGLFQVDAGSGGAVDLATPYPFSIYSTTAGIANTGTIEIVSGTVTYPTTSFGANVGTIDTGTFQVDAGASLLGDTADAITTTNGTVVLNGNGYFPDVAGLTTIGGGFTVGAGATFTTVGDLSNTGTLTVGGKLTVTGGLTESGSASTLAFAVSGGPGSAGAPALTVNGVTTLAGNLAAAEIGGYGATAGIAFPVATFTSAATGSFASTAGVAPSFTAAVTPTIIVLNSTGVAGPGGGGGGGGGSGTANLGITSITGPTTGSPGAAAAISWVVTNTGTGAATGNWRDSVYLTINGTIDNNSILLGRVAETGPIAAGATYTGTLSATLPAVPVAAYKIVVLTDSGLAVSDTDRTNNAGASAAFTTTIPSLTLSNTTRGTINVGQDVLYRLTVPAGNDVVLAATFDVVTEADIYVSYNAIPTTTSFDESALATTNTLTTGTSTIGSLLIPVHQAGDYYVLVHGREGATASPGFTLRPAQLGFSAQSISPTSGGVLTDVTVTIKGSNLTGRTTVSFVATSGFASQSATLTPISTHLVDSNTLVATFHLGNPAPTYQVVVTDGSQSVTLPAPFTTSVKIGSAFQYYLTVPSVSRGDLTGTAYLHYSNPNYYSNAGGSDIPAQYFYISAPNTNFRLVGDPTYSQGSLELLGIAQSGDAGVLAPGESGVIPIQYTQTMIQSHQDVEISVSQLDPNASIDLSVLKETLKPANEPDDAWNVIYANFLNTVGSTVGGLSTVLANAATALGYQGTYTPDISKLMDYALKAAGGFGTISQRFNLGVLGRGQSDPFAHAVAADSNGNVTITSGGRERVFLIQTNGTYQGLNGDTAALKLGGGIYTLTESTGALTVFNGDGTLNYSQDASGNRLTAAYTGGQLVSLTATDGDTYTFAYNAAGRVSQVTDPEGRATTYTYDSTGQLLDSVTSPAGTTSFTYVTDPNSPALYAVTSITYPDGLSQSYTYDALGRLAGESNTGGAIPTTYSYDALGTTVTTTDALGNQSTETMSPTGAPVQISDALGDIGRIAYTSTGRVASETSAGGFATTTTYDAVGNPTSVTAADGTTVNYSYDPTLDRLQSLTDPKGNKTAISYDASGNVISTTDAAGQSNTYTYNSAGRVTQTSSPAGRIVGTTYDTHGLVTMRSYSDGTSITYTYDAHRNLASATDAAGTVSYSYDPADRLTSVAYPGGLSLSYTYDANGRRIRVVDQTGFVTNYAYTAIGQLSTITDATGATITSYTYDADGRIVGQDNGNGTSTTYTYDAAGQMLTLVNHGTGGSINSSFAYTYNADGERSSMTGPGGTTTYAYDPIGQLTTVVLPGGRTISYAYDADGNRSLAADTAAGTITYAVNNLNEYVTTSGTTYAYDADGNLTATTNSAGTTTYGYNVRGLLVSVAALAGTTTYTYDAVGDRISTTTGGVTTKYLTDPSGFGNVNGTFDASGAAVNHYVYGMGLVSQVTAAGSASYYDFDGTGNTADVTNAAGGISNAYSYLPFGSILTSTGSASNPFTFQGQYGVQNTAAGLYYMRARLYDPGTGRFVQHDPLGFQGGDTNLYRYGGNDPINHVDPGGTYSISTTVAKQILGGLSDLSQTIPFSYEGAVRFLGNGILEAEGPAGAARALGVFIQGNSDYILRVGEQLDLLAENGYTVPAELASRIANGIASREAESIVLQQVINDVTAPVVSAAAATTVTTEGVAAGSGFSLSLGEGLGLFQVGYSILSTLADANRFNNEFPDGIPIQVQESITGTAYAHAIKQPLAHELIQNLINQHITPSQQFIDDAIRLDADLVRARNRANTTTLQWATMFINANDPNSIIGPAGFGPAGFVPAGGTFPYEITFENKSTASAPAQTVTIVQQLDPNLDWTSFQLTGLGFGSHVIDVPAGLTAYQTSVAISATLRVDISATLNTLTGLVTWIFRSIDPTTGDAPSGALAGFLPPDDAAGDGAGYVTYTINPKVNLATGSTVQAQATITFDGNAPISTPQILNTIDAVAPTSTVAALPAAQSNTYFTVNWSGSDDANGSGIAGYTILVSQDGGPFTVWLKNTSATSAVYLAQPGHSYAFISTAADNAGNLQTQAATAQATTTVPAVVRTITFSAGHPARFIDAAGVPVVITLGGPGTGTLSFISNANADPVSLLLADTTVRSSVSVRVSHGNLVLGTVQVNGSLANFNAPHTSFVGSFTVTGTLANLVLGDEIITGSTLSIAGATVATSIRLGTVHDFTLTDAAAIRSLTVTNWTNGPLNLDQLTAPSIGVINVIGNFDPTLTLTGSALDLRSITVRGTLSGAWSLAGSIGQISAGTTTSTWTPTIAGGVASLTVRGSLSGIFTARSLGNAHVGGAVNNATITLSATAAQLGKAYALNSFTVAGELLDSQIITQGNIRSVSAGGFSGSELFAGIVSGQSGLPATTSAFAIGASIGAVRSNGKSAFANTLIAASAIGSVALVNATTDNGGTIFGVATEKLASFSLHQPKQKAFTWTARQPVSKLTTLPGDLRVTVV